MRRIISLPVTFSFLIKSDTSQNIAAAKTIRIPVSPNGLCQTVRRLLATGMLSAKIMVETNIARCPFCFSVIIKLIDELIYELSTFTYALDLIQSTLTSISLFHPFMQLMNKNGVLGSPIGHNQHIFRRLRHETLDAEIWIDALCKVNG